MNYIILFSWSLYDERIAQATYSFSLARIPYSCNIHKPSYVIKSQTISHQQPNHSLALRHSHSLMNRHEELSCFVVSLGRLCCCRPFGSSHCSAHFRSWKTILLSGTLRCQGSIHQPSSYSSKQFALAHRFQDPPNAVAVYLLSQYAWMESKPLALPQRFHDPPPVVAVYLPSQYPAFA